MRGEQENLSLPPEARAKLRLLASKTRRTKSSVIEILLMQASVLPEPDLALLLPVKPVAASAASEEGEEANGAA